MTFRHQTTGRVETLKWAGVWCFLFGPLYFAKWDLWRVAGFVFVLALVTGGLSWFFVPFATRALAEWEYDRKGWARI